jgi:CheY-like chemotaxis protein
MRNSTTVLIVDDDADIREVMKIFLEANGYHVNVAADGLDALEQLRAGPRPELILLDLMMPRLDGEQFLKQFRASRFADIPVVIISGYTLAEKKANELMAACCLMKPVEAEHLLTTVRRFTLHAPKNDVA